MDRITSLALLAPDTPDWLVIPFLIILLVAGCCIIVWGIILEIRYTGPYTLKISSSSQKWRQAVIIAIIQTGFIPLLGFAAPVLSPYPDQWPFIPLCFTLWIVVIPVAILIKRWDFDRRLNFYWKMDLMIKGGSSNSIPYSSVLRIFSLFATREQKRFFKEGFPKE
jgi:hypothetical protein